MTTPTPDHVVPATDEVVHFDFDRTRDAVVTAEPGDVVRFECRDATNGQLGPDATVEDVLAMEVEGHALTGPVDVAGAEPGDAVEVEILALDHEGWGVSYFYPGEQGWGLLDHEFPEAGFHAWDLVGDVAHFDHGIEVPIHAFPGVVGLAPDEPGPHDTTPPRRVGGNLDVKHLTAGATLALPVEVEGGRLSVGDCHAAQGDGEVCVTGIEAPMSVTVRVGLRKDARLEGPEFDTAGPFTPTGADEPMHATTGVADDLMRAAEQAVSRMVAHLSAERGLTREEAYILCSAAVDLKMNQVVDQPNWTVSAYLPESIFPA